MCNRRQLEFVRHPPRLAAFAREHRFAPTDSEARLWRALRCCQLGVEFRRQVALAGRFIADFLAREPRLIVEVDGGYHARREAADARRDAKLRRLGYRVLRVSAEEVMRELPEVLECIRRAALAGGEV